MKTTVDPSTRFHLFNLVRALHGVGFPSQSATTNHVTYDGDNSEDSSEVTNWATIAKVNDNPEDDVRNSWPAVHRPQATP